MRALHVLVLSWAFLVPTAHGAHAKKKAPAAAEAAPAEVADKSLAPNGVAVVEAPASGKLTAKLAAQLARMASKELEDQGFDVVAPDKVLAAHAAARRKLSPCGDAVACLSGVGRVAGTAYVLSFSSTAAGKNMGFKLTVVDAAEGKVVSNIMSLVSKPDAGTLTETVKKQVPRAAAALNKVIAEKQSMNPVAALLAASGSPPREQSGSSGEIPSLVKAKEKEGEKTVAAADEVPPLVKAKEKAAEPPAKQSQVLKELVARADPKPATGSESTEGGSTTKTVDQSKSRVAPYLLMGAGAVAIGVGVGAFGTKASSAVDDFKAGRDPLAARDAAKSNATLADVFSGVGIAAVAVGAGMLLFGGSDGDARAESGRVTLSLGPSAGGIGYAGSF